VSVSSLHIERPGRRGTVSDLGHSRGELAASCCVMQRAKEAAVTAVGGLQLSYRDFEDEDDVRERIVLRKFTRLMMREIPDLRPGIDPMRWSIRARAAGGPEELRACDRCEDPEVEAESSSSSEASNDGAVDGELEPIDIALEAYVPIINIVSLMRAVWQPEPDAVCSICSNTPTAVESFVGTEAYAHWCHQTRLDLWIDGAAHNANRCSMCRAVITDGRRPVVEDEKE
jgi:hypothetical protein